MRRIIMILAVGVMLSASATIALAGEIGFIEAFSLAKDRAEVLKRLIPGTEEHYYYTALYHQNRGELDKVDEVLKAWIAQRGHTHLAREIEDRQALLRYEADPQKALAHIIDRLGLRFDHQRDVVGRERALATTLDDALISRSALAQLALARHSDTLEGFEDAALDWLVSMNLEGDQRRNLLRRLSRPDYEGLPQLIVDDLNYEYSGGFGSHSIHDQLLLPQLEACLALKPDLLDETAFVNAYLKKLRPSADVNLEHDLAQREAYLDRLWAFVSRLAPAHNSLKAHVLYQRLLHDRAQGKYDKARFMAYVALPRSAEYARRDYINDQTRRGYWANLHADYREQTLLPRIGDDEPLVRSYLTHFFATEETHAPYEAYMSDRYLRAVFAETKATLGLGDPEAWFAKHPGDFKALTERVDLDFAFTNKPLFGVDDPVELALQVKNVETLLVKVFEINTANYYRAHQREVDTDIELDGLVANSERVIKYTEAPIRRVLRTFKFPELEARGTYVIEFIGNGRSSRALVRKGALRFLSRTSTAGHVLTILDEANQQVRDAKVYLSGHEYAADAEDGTITIPFTARPGAQPIIISGNGMNALDTLDHQAERYALEAGIYVDREALSERATAQVVVRPALSLNGAQVTLSVLEEPTLVITSVDHDGVSTTKEVAGFKLSEDAESVYAFQVPRRLARISFTLKAKVQSLSQNQKQSLSSSASFSLNQIDVTDKVEDLHLMRINGAYVLEVLGKTGEARPARAVALKLKHRDFRDEVEATLKTDAAGRITLGALEHIDTLGVTGPEGTQHTWRLARDQRGYPDAIHGRAGEVISLPYMGAQAKAERDELSLLELRGSTFKADRFDALSIRDGFITISGLPAGDYDLLIKPVNQRVRLRLTAGITRDGYALSPTRHLEIRDAKPLQIARIKTDSERVIAQLKNATKFSRVHVFATRYMPEYDVYSSLDAARTRGPQAVTLGHAKSRYVAGRNIGDEYRYILDRKYAKKFPGNMLERPELLLNPWAIRKTDSGTQTAAPGGGYGAGGKGFGGGRMSGYGAAKTAAPKGNFSNLNFLGEASAVLLNLRPDKDGVVTINRADLGAHQQIHVVAVDPESVVYRQLSLAEQEMEFRDRFLVAGLDPKGHFAEKKQISIVKAGEAFKLEDIATAKFEAYDSLARVYSLMVTLSGDQNLVEFGFILNWPKLTEAQKREKYSKYASHELNYFLFRKDRQFFDAVILPHLKNKKDKTFMDHVLLGDDLSGYLEPWRFARLNIVERILLGQRIKGEAAHAARHVKDLNDLRAPDIERFNQLFSAALKSSSLDTDDRFGYEQAAKESLEEKMLEAEAEPEPMEAFALSAAAPSMAPPPAPKLKRERSKSRKRGRRMKKRARVADDLDMALAGEMDGAEREGYFKKDKKKRRASRRFYQKLDKTKEWVENNYYHLPIEQQNASLIVVNDFWKDYAAHGIQATPFFSRSFAEATRNFPEMMLALAVLDLPFTPGEHQSKAEGDTFVLNAATGMVVFHKEIKATPPSSIKTPILVSQNFFKRGDRYTYVNGERLDKYVTDEFLTHTVYGCQVVITNPTSSAQKLDALLQIPRGAIPVLNGKETNSIHLRLDPYSTKRIDYYFYFPFTKKYRHYPVHIAKNEELIAFSAPFVFNVVKTLTKIDKTSWDYVSQNGTQAQVLEFLDKNNIERLDLNRVAWRMSDPAFFNKVITLLDTRHVYHQTLWSYGLKHNALPAARDFLRESAYPSRCGQSIATKLLTIDPVERLTYQHMEYSPLVNARTHQLGKTRKIVNDRFFQQYTRLMKALSYHKSLDDDDLMAVTYYMLLQDRVEEALGFFKRVNPKALETQIQYDYFKAYLAFYQEDVKAARAIAAKYTDYGVDRWRGAFANIIAQANEIDGKVAKVIDPEDRDQAQAQLADAAASFEFSVASKEIKLVHQNLEAVTVNYYLMDIELLFSRQPFVGTFSGQFSTIQPNQSDIIKLMSEDQKASNKPQTTLIKLPKRFHAANVMIEIVGDGARKSQAYYSNAMTAQVIENYGQIRVTEASSGKPISKAYVKVYSRSGGSIKFYKDGYTDLRGRFDYTSLNTNEIDHVDRFAILILSPSHGAVVREAAPPKR